jgi:hypothetical protein
MPNPTLFCLNRGDVVLTAALLTRIRNGIFALTLWDEKNGAVKFDSVVANAIVNGTTTLRALHPAHGHRSLTQQVLNGLT